MDVSNMLVRALLVASGRAGVDRARFLDEAGLDAAALDDPHARMPLEHYSRVVGAAYALSGDPAFGLHMGERMGMGSFDVLGHLVEHSTSLRDAVMVAVRYSRIVSEGPRIALEEHADSATIRLLLPKEEGPRLLLAAEFSTVALLRMVRSFAGEHALARRVLFAYPAPAHRSEYTRLFAGREAFSHEFTGLEIERAWLDKKPVCRQNELRGFLQTRAEFLLARADQAASAAERVSRWLAAQSDLARPTLQVVAQDLGVSTRTLRRRLHEEHAQFSALLDTARAVRAKRLLADATGSIQDAAYALGFRTPSAFSRAFKRWTGMAPKSFRAVR